MSANQEEPQNTQETTQNEVTAWADRFKISIGNILSSWQLKVGLVIAFLAAIFLAFFFWQHVIAVMGMKSWASRSGAKPIECMIKDTNDDHYVSCSAILNDQVVPLECGANLLNIGCRVNYGAAQPNLRLLNPSLPKM